MKTKTELDIPSLVNMSKSLRVLYVEDSEEAREQTLKLLKNFFINNLQVATDGQDGLEKFKSSNFDIVFTDLEMPNMNGLEMISAIRMINPHIPIVIFSAHSKNDYFLQAINAGVDGYILKPYDFQKIAEVISKVIEKYNLKEINKNILTLEYGYIWDKKDDTLIKNGEPVKLTFNEVSLFKFFALSPNKIIPSDVIESYIFQDVSPDNKKIRNLISRLKIKLGDSLIESHYGLGYKFIVL